MTVAVIGTGNLGSALAGDLVAGGERIVLAARDQADALDLARRLGDGASAASVEDAIQAAETVVFAVYLASLTELLGQYRQLLDDKVVIDPSNPIRIDAQGGLSRSLPDGQSAASIVAPLLPPGAHYVKAFGTLDAGTLASAARRGPRRAVLFYASDDDRAAAVAEHLISVAGFDPLKAGGVAEAARLEGPDGDLQIGGMHGRLVDRDEAEQALARKAD